MRLKANASIWKQLYDVCFVKYEEISLDDGFISARCCGESQQGCALVWVGVLICDDNNH